MEPLRKDSAGTERQAGPGPAPSQGPAALGMPEAKPSLPATQRLGPPWVWVI